MTICHIEEVIIGREVKYLEDKKKYMVRLVYKDREIIVVRNTCDISKIGRELI